MDCHKCDMYCLWEDLDDTYEKCSNCKWNRYNISNQKKDNRIDNGLNDSNDHLRHKHDSLSDDEYLKYLDN